MIKNITATGKYIQVNGGAGSTHINNYGNAQGVGNVRYNTINQNFEIYDGNNWVTFNAGYSQVGLTGEAESLLDWVRVKRLEEEYLNKEAETYPVLKDLLLQKKDIENKIEVIKTVLKN